MNLGVLDGREILYVDVLESPHSFRLVSRVGMRRPLHCTGLGKAVLAWQPAAFLDELFAVTKFEKLTTHSITRPSELDDRTGTDSTPRLCARQRKRQNWARAVLPLPCLTLQDM